MHLTRQAEYAIYTICYLAESGEQTSVPSATIAENTGCPKSFVGNIVTALVRAGLLRTTRGRRGGVRLAGDPADISILNIIEAIHGNFVFFEPSKNEPSNARVEEALVEIDNKIVAVLEQVKCSSLINIDTKVQSITKDVASQESSQKVSQGDEHAFSTRSH